jgi:hypothetical protein
MTLCDVMIDIRAKLLLAIETKDRDMADTAFVTLSMLRDSAYERKAEQQAIVIVDMLDSVRDIVGGVYFKAALPSINDIRAAFPYSQEAS